MSGKHRCLCMSKGLLQRRLSIRAGDLQQSRELELKPPCCRLPLGYPTCSCRDGAPGSRSWVLDLSAFKS